MKKICLTAVAASAMLFASQNVSAQEVAVKEDVKVEATAQQTADFRKIEITEVPSEVQQALERDYEGAVISEAYVKEKEGEKKFKLVVKTADGLDQELYADAEGNWIEKEEK